MRLFLFVFCIVSSFTSLAQSAVVRHNIVYVGNEELFKLYSVGTFAHQTFKVKNLMDEDLILIDQSTLRNNQGTLLMKFIFTGMPDAEAYMPLNVNYKKQLARLLVNYNVIKNNKLDEQGVATFCKSYHISNFPSKYIAEEVTSNNEVRREEKKENRREVKNPERKIADPGINKEEKEESVSDNSEEKTTVEYDENGNVKRDITQQVYLSGSKIRQDYKEIGSYTSETKMLLGQEGKQITIYSLDGNKVGISRFINGDEQCELLTIRDNKTWNIAIPKGDIYTIVKDIIKVLSDKMYL